MKKILVVLLLVAFGFAQSTPEPRLTAEDSSVISAALHEALKDTPEVKQTVLIDHTSTGPPPGWWGLTPMGRPSGFADVFPSELRERFRSENKSPAVLDPVQLSCPGKCTMVDLKTLEPIFNETTLRAKTDWDMFYKRFPQSQGLTVVSRVAYNAAGNVAMVYVGTMRNHLSGEGRLFLFEKTSAGWIERAGETVWIS